MHSEGGTAQSPGEVHRCLGCSRKCGRCMNTIKKIMNEAVCSAHAHGHGHHAHSS